MKFCYSSLLFILAVVLIVVSCVHNKTIESVNPINKWFEIGR
jgi:hypothetical protein